MPSTPSFSLELLEHASCLPLTEYCQLCTPDSRLAASVIESVDNLRYLVKVGMVGPTAGAPPSAPDPAPAPGPPPPAHSTLVRGYAGALYIDGVLNEVVVLRHQAPHVTIQGRIVNDKDMLPFVFSPAVVQTGKRGRGAVDGDDSGVATSKGDIRVDFWEIEESGVEPAKIRVIDGALNSRAVDESTKDSAAVSHVTSYGEPVTTHGVTSGIVFVKYLKPVPCATLCVQYRGRDVLIASGIIKDAPPSGKDGATNLKPRKASLPRAPSRPLTVSTAPVQPQSLSSSQAQTQSHTQTQTQTQIQAQHQLPSPCLTSASSSARSSPTFPSPIPSQASLEVQVPNPTAQNAAGLPLHPSVNMSSTSNSGTSAALPHPPGGGVSVHNHPSSGPASLSQIDQYRLLQQQAQQHAQLQYMQQMGHHMGLGANHGPSFDALGTSAATGSSMSSMGLGGMVGLSSYPMVSLSMNPYGTPTGMSHTMGYSGLLNNGYNPYHSSLPMENPHRPAPPQGMSQSFQMQQQHLQQQQQQHFLNQPLQPTPGPFIPASYASNYTAPTIGPGIDNEARPNTRTASPAGSQETIPSQTPSTEPGAPVSLPTVPIPTPPPADVSLRDGAPCDDAPREPAAPQPPGEPGPGPAAPANAPSAPPASPVTPHLPATSDAPRGPDPEPGNR